MNQGEGTGDQQNEIRKDESIGLPGTSGTTSESASLPPEPTIPPSDPTTVQQPATATTTPRWWPFALAIVLEIAAIGLMTWMRYTFQGLDPDYFDLGKSANLYGFLIVLPFILLDITALLRVRRRTLYAQIIAVAIPAIGLILLSILATTTVENQPTLGVAYLGLRAGGLGIYLGFGGSTSASRSIWRRLLATTGYSLLFAIGSYLLVVISIILNPLSPTSTADAARSEYDAGVILGAAVWSGNRPSPVFRERIYRGYELMQEGVVEFLVLTGGNAPNELSEAEVAKQELLKLGADPTRIALEKQTSSTVEQILFIRDELTKQKWESFVIISDQFHLKRALEICAFNDIAAVGIASESPLGPTNLAIYHLRESAALLLYWMYGL